MKIINAPSLTTEPMAAENSQALLPDHYPSQESEKINSTSGSYTAPLPPDRLFRQMELGLESIVEKLLLSKTGENDNLLAHMHDIMEKMFVISALKITEGNISRAAKLLGINRNTLSKKLRVFGPTS